MRLRSIIIGSIVAFILGLTIWFFDNRDSGLATGEGGLPLIRASTNPVKLPPEEPGGEVMPHADSTVFAAISSDAEADPSMEGLKPPEAEQPESATEFAGLNTGFALPKEQETKTESLFTGEEVSARKSYVSGIEPDAIGGNTPALAVDPMVPATPAPKVDAAPEVVPEPVKEEPKVVETPKPAAEPVAEKAPEPKAEPDALMTAEPKVAPIAQTQAIPETTPELPVAEDASNVAENLEQQEMQLIRPVSKPKPPAVTEVARDPIKSEDVAEVKKTAETIVAKMKPAPVTETPAASDTGGYVIQLSSTPSMADAERSWAQMQSLYPQALSGLKPSYKDAAIPGKGTYIRLRAGTLSREQANARCDAIRREDPRHGGCLVIRE